MSNEIFLTILVVAFALLILALRTLVKSTVQESVRHEFEVERQKMRQDFEREMAAQERKDRFRLASLDERLRVHQQAYAFAREILKTLHSPRNDKYEVLKRCEEFWDKNCLYLAHEARKSFWQALLDYYFYENTLQYQRNVNTPEALEAPSKVFKRLRELPAIIAKGVDLEAMGDEGQPLVGENVVPEDSKFNAV